MISRGRLSAVALVALTIIVYAAGLRQSPIYMHDAEVLFALHERSIAATLRDANGTFLPLYFHMPAIGANVWFHPMIVYWSAIFLKVLPFSEWSVRFPSVIVGAVDVALMYLVATHVFRDRRYAWLSAALLALTPAHFIHSRLAMDYLYPVPFVLLWLWCLLEFDESERPVWLWGAGLALGVGFYSYIAAVAFMPAYVVFTWLYLLDKYRRPKVAHLTTTVAFCIPVMFFVVWRVMYPFVFSGTMDRYAITKSGTVLGLLHFFNYGVIGDYVSLYWNFFNPNFLFLVGSPNFQSSTRAAGVFLLPVILFLAVGLYDVAARERSRFGWLLIAGFVTAPIPAVLVEEPYAIYREMVILPFAILLATFGVRRLMASDARAWRAVTIAALVAMPLQFGYFVRDYFTTYPLYAFGWFGGNTPGAVEKVLALDAAHPVPAVYLSKKIAYARERWEFYLARDGRVDLLAKTRMLNPDDPIASVPSGSLIVVPIEEREVKDPRMRAPDVRMAAEIMEPFGDRLGAFAVFERP